MVHTTTTTKKSLVLFNTTYSITSNLLGFAANLLPGPTYPSGASSPFLWQHRWAFNQISLAKSFSYTRVWIFVGKTRTRFLRPLSETAQMYERRIWAILWDHSFLLSALSHVYARVLLNCSCFLVHYQTFVVKELFFCLVINWEHILGPVLRSALGRPNSEGVVKLKKRENIRLCRETCHQGRMALLRTQNISLRFNNFKLFMKWNESWNTIKLLELALIACHLWWKTKPCYLFDSRTKSVSRTSLVDSHW